MICKLQAVVSMMDDGGHNSYAS